MVIEQSEILVIDRVSGFIQMKDDDAVKLFCLGKKEASALAALLSSDEKCCPKKKLKEAIWPDRQHVEDNQVAAIISSLRKSLIKTKIKLELKAITNYGYQIIYSDNFVIELVG